MSPSVTPTVAPSTGPTPAEEDTVGGVNYCDTFIAVAPDSTATHAEIPPLRAGKPTIARIQFAMIHEDPYRYTSEDVLFASSPEGRHLDDSINEDDRLQLQARFFEAPRACLRASPLPKRFGWGLHFDRRGRVAVYGVDSDGYRDFVADPTLQQLAAMRSRRSRG